MGRPFPDDLDRWLESLCALFHMTQASPNGVQQIHIRFLLIADLLFALVHLDQILALFFLPGDECL